MDIKQNLAENIARHRKLLKLTQAELGEKLNYSDNKKTEDSLGFLII